MRRHFTIPIGPPGFHVVTIGDVSRRLLSGVAMPGEVHMARSSGMEPRPRSQATRRLAASSTLCTGTSGMGALHRTQVQSGKLS